MDDLVDLGGCLGGLFRLIGWILLELLDAILWPFEWTSGRRARRRARRARRRHS